MGFTYQTYPIVGGTVLIIERVQSQNYAAGSAGWAIDADGDAEFNNVVVRGTLITGPDGTQHIAVNGSDAPQGIAFYTGEPDETFPGVIQPDFDASELEVTYSSPLVAGHGGASLILATGRTGADLDRISLEAQSIDAAADVVEIDAAGGTYFLLDNDGSGQRAQINAPRIFLLDTSISNSAGCVVTGGDLFRIGQAWIGTGTTPLAGTWVDTAGSRFAYTKDATGRVQVRGRVSGGGAGATIVTLPAGFRPSSNLDFSMRSGTTLCGVGVSTGGVLTVTANLATASAGGINLDVIIFPTL